MISLAVIWTGASSSLGTQPPLLGTTLPPDATYIRDGIQLFALPSQNSGAQGAFLDCMHRNGVSVTLIERARTGATSGMLQTTYVPRAVADATSRGLVVDAVVLIAGGPDAKRQEDAYTFSGRVWGPWTDAGPGTRDTSIMGQVREAWGPGVPLVVATPPNWNGSDPLYGIPGDETHYWHAQVRASVLTGCQADGARCRPVVTTQADVPLSEEDGHPEPEGYAVLGEGICAAVLEVVR